MARVAQDTLIQPAVRRSDGSFHCDALIFDLDGTLFDTRPGIKNCIRKTIADLGLTALSDSLLDTFVGPPLRTAYRQHFAMTEDELELAVRTYRKHYSLGGMYEAEAYEGIARLLQDLVDKGYRLCVGTSKAWVFAHRILRHFGLRHYFEAVFGCYQNGRLDSKQLVLQAALGHLSGRAPLPPGRLPGRMGVARDAGFPAEPGATDGRGAASGDGLPKRLRVLMIGDSDYDVEGAKALGLPTIGVSYGYGTVEALKASGAALILAHPMEIAERLPPLR